MDEPVANFVTRSVSFRGLERPVLVSTTGGPPVILLHEIFGMTSTVAALGDTIRASGFRVYMPVLFGSTAPKSGASGKVQRIVQFACIARQFRVLAQNDAGPWADWLRDLADSASEQARGQAVGVIGLCLTGNFALSMAMNPRVRAPVMGEPSLPLRGNGLHLSAEELTAVRARPDLKVRAYRYSTDIICRAALFTRLEEELGSSFEGVTIEVQEKLHSVFTEHLRDSAGRLRHDKVGEVIDFFRDRLL